MRYEAARTAKERKRGRQGRRRKSHQTISALCGVSGAAERTRGQKEAVLQKPEGMRPTVNGTVAVGTHGGEGI